MVSLKNKRVIIGVPIHNSEFSLEEKISLRHLLRYLRDIDRCFIIPQSLVVENGDFHIKRFPDVNFKSVQSYNKLLVSKEFYESFTNYEYILIYQLDSLVFSDQLLTWCEKGFDYIGAPWLKFESGGYIEKFTRVGNGGFSLRKVQSMLNVIDATRCVNDGINFYWSDFGDLSPRHSQRFKYFEQLLLKLGLLDYAKWYLSRFDIGEDIFWSYMASRFYPDFKVPSVDQALGFSFEVLPTFCFSQNNFKLPFGCHAWSKYDREFWTPYLLDR